MPASDFASHDPEFSQEQVDQCTRIIAGLRRINARIMRLGGSLEALSATADQVEALLDSLETVTRARAMRSYRFEFDRSDPNSVTPFNPGTGEYNPLAPVLAMTVEGQSVVGRCEFSNCHEGPPDSVHGGMVAAVYDQLLAYAVMLHGVTGPTIWLKVTYLKPMPINVPLRFECTVTSADRKKYSVKGRCYRGEEKLSEAEALMLGAHEIAVTGEPIA